MRRRDGICPKCDTEFERPDYIKPNHSGFKCPVCKSHGYMTVGVIHFTPDINLNIIPKEITTA
jgi:hypothetical protein